MNLNIKIKTNYLPKFTDFFTIVFDDKRSNIKNYLIISLDECE